MQGVPKYSGFSPIKFHAEEKASPKSSDQLRCFAKDTNEILWLMKMDKPGYLFHTQIFSTTAYYVNHKDNNYPQNLKDNIVHFKELRKNHSVATNDLLTALKENNLVNQPNTRATATSLKEARKTLLAATKNCYENLKKMVKDCGVLNCGEYAFWGFAQIVGQQLLTNGYSADIAKLKNVRLPSKELDQKYYPDFNDQIKDHDHAFVTIKNREGHVEFVIDLWQSQIEASNYNAFFGGVDEFLSLINRNADDRYVVESYKQIDINDIYSLSENSSDKVAKEMFTGFERDDKFADFV